MSYGTGYAALMIMGGLRAQNRVLIHRPPVALGPPRLRSLATPARRSSAPHRRPSTGHQGSGVHHAIDYRSQDFKAEVRRLTDGEGVDIIMDALGPTSFRKDYRILGRAAG